MREYQRKKKIRQILYSRAALAALLLLIALLSRATWGVYEKERESRKYLERAETELAALAARENLLQDDITRLKTREGIETEIREQFQVAKPGERMVVLVEERRTAKEEDIAEQSLLSKFFDLFR